MPRFQLGRMMFWASLAETCEDAITSVGCVGILGCELESGCAFTPGGVLSCYCGSARPLEECLDASNSERAVLTCKKPGIVTVTVAARGLDGGCGTQQSVGITCVAPPNGATVAPGDTKAALVGDYRGLDNRACWACAAAHCLDVDGTLPCELRKDPAERQLCLGLLQCELESGCGAGAASVSPGLGACYCSRNDGCWTAGGAHDGACAKQIESALQSSDTNYLMNHLWGDGTLPGDPADTLTYCLALNGCSSCFAD